MEDRLNQFNKPRSLNQRSKSTVDFHEGAVAYYQRGDEHDSGEDHLPIAGIGFELRHCGAELKHGHAKVMAPWLPMCHMRR